MTRAVLLCAFLSLGCGAVLRTWRGAVCVDVTRDGVVTVRQDGAVSVELQEVGGDGGAP